MDLDRLINFIEIAELASLTYDVCHFGSELSVDGIQPP